MLVRSSTAIFVILASVCTLAHSVCRLEKNRRFLNCRIGELISVPRENLSVGLREIDLSDNSIAMVENGTFAALSELQTLHLCNNRLEYLGSGAFQGLVSLLTLNLSSNPLMFNARELTTTLFEPLESLKVIRLQRNAGYTLWKDIDRSFSTLKNLSDLFLDFPDNFKFLNRWGALSKLSRISTSEEETSAPSFRSSRVCRWKTIEKNAFEALRNVSITELHLVNCEIAFIQTGAFEPLRSLQKLELSFNVRLGLRRALLSLKGLEPINMTAIKMSAVNARYASLVNSVRKDNMLKTGDFKYVSEICVRSVDLSQNDIFYEHGKSNPVEFRMDCLESLNMSYHGFHFIPRGLIWSFRNSPKLEVLDFSKIPCGKPSAISATQASQLPTKLNLPYITLPPNLSWISVAGCEDWFPAPVQFNFRFSQSLRYFVAADINLEECWFAPAAGFPNGLTHLDISGAKCRKMPPTYFKNLEKITTLKLSGCPYIEGVLRSQSSPFGFLSALEEVDLSHNKISDLNPKLFKKNRQLTEVNLSNNKLQHLPGALAQLTGLRKLDLSFNSISSFRSEEMRQLNSWMARDGHHFQILLTGNPLQCTCETVIFIRWLYHQKTHLDNVDKYECLLSNGTWVSLKIFQIYLADFEVKCISHTYLIISVVIILTSLVLILVFTGIYRYRLNLRYWLYTKLMPPENMFVDHDYIYDAFVAYTSDEYEWIIQQLRPRLELVDDPARLCIHDRDFIPGKPIHENIVDKMKESRKILLIISPGFLESRFGPLEIEYAGMKCLEEGRDDTILCVLMEEIPVRQMPRALRNLWHKITFLKWSDNPDAQLIFWRNLKAAITQFKE